MSEVSVTVEPEAITPPSPASSEGQEPATNEHDVAIAEAEAAAEIAIAEINAEAREAEAERIADAIETEAVRSKDEEIAWLKERVAFLEGLSEGQQNPTPEPEEAETLNLSIPLPSSETEATDPAELATEAETSSIPQSTSDATDETPMEATPGSAVAVVVAEAVPAPRKRRRLII